MKLNQEPFGQAAQEAKKTMLSESEKSAMRAQLMDFMKQHPIQPAVAVPAQASGGSFWKPFSQKPLYASLALALAVVLCGAGVSFAAQNSLPGDVLYPIKTQVNEKVLAWFDVSDQARAEHSIALANTRLEEFEKVAAKGKLTTTAAAQAESSFSENVAAAQARIDSLDNGSGNDPAVSAQLNAQLQTALTAHINILNNLAGRNNDAARVSDFAKTVTTHVDSVAKATEKSQAHVFAKESQEVKNDAQHEFSRAQASITSAASFLDAKKAAISADATASAQANLDAANALVVQGQQKLEVQDYQAAFLLFQQAVSVAQGTQITVSAAADLNINGADAKDIIPGNILK